MQPTYEGLKQAITRKIHEIFDRLQPTYEGLKLTTETIQGYLTQCLQPTYEGLKPSVILEAQSVGFEFAAYL